MAGGDDEVLGDIKRGDGQEKELLCWECTERFDELCQIRSPGVELRATGSSQSQVSCRQQDKSVKDQRHFSMVQRVQC